jgi:hypothetical protein
MRKKRGQSTIELIVLTAVSVTSLVLLLNIILKRPSNNAFNEHFNQYSEIIAGNAAGYEPPANERFPNN